MGAFPEDLRFCEEHLWIRIEGDRARIGMTDFLVDQLGRALDVDLTDPGKEVDASAELGHITGSGEGSFDVFTPLAGTLVEVNEELFENPDLLTDDPYDEGWLFVVEGVDPEEVKDLLNPEEYQAAVELAEAEE